MGWKENRRRKRTWYRHYKRLADQVLDIIAGPGPFAAEAILELFFNLYESRRFHGKRFIAQSAYESMRLACKDAGLDEVALQMQRGERDRDIRGQLSPPPEERRVRLRAREDRGPLPPLPASVLAQLGGFMPVEQDSDDRNDPTGVVRFDATQGEGVWVMDEASSAPAVRAADTPVRTTEDAAPTALQPAAPVILDQFGRPVPPLQSVPFNPNTPIEEIPF